MMTCSYILCLVPYLSSIHELLAGMSRLLHKYYIQCEYKKSYLLWSYCLAFDLIRHTLLYHRTNDDVVRIEGFRPIEVRYITHSLHDTHTISVRVLTR